MTRATLFVWLPRASLALAVGTAIAVAWREGGGGDAMAVLPQPVTAASDVAPRGTGAESNEVTTRLVEALRDARLDVPALAAARPYFQTYWRKLAGPWVRLPGKAGELAVTVALRGGPDAESQWTVPITEGHTWSPQARVWNMNEGSFDQREAIYAPTPAKVVFRVTVPHAARLRFSPALALPFGSACMFDVSVVEPGGGERTLSQTRIAGSDARRWFDVDVDMKTWAGKTVDLVFRTSVDKLLANEKPYERKPSSPSAEESALEGAAPEPQVVSPMALALWGNPVLVANEPTRVPYDVLWIVVDAMRPDVAASLHDPTDDAAKLSAHRPPLDALLPVVQGLMPSVDRLASSGVHFTHAWSAASWTRPGTLAMLTGARSSELGIDPTAWVLPPEQAAHFYASNPPLLPLVLRRSGVVTAAFVNNFFMAGYAAVGVDMGFDRVTDHRYRTRDTAEITHDAVGWLDAHARDRFFLFVNYNSPHEPYDPTKEMLARIPPPPAGPRDSHVRAYMAEAAKDDGGIGALLGELETLGLTRSTLVIVTSDHGETLSSAHDGIGLERMPMRFHHAVGNFEETTRVPIVMALPGIIDGGRAIGNRVRSTDIAPTVLDVEGLEADPRASGSSMMPLVREPHDEAAGTPRTVVTEGRASRAVIWDRWRLVVHDAVGDAGAVDDELYDLVDDPGERRNIARGHPETVAEMRTRLAAALANTKTADVAATEAPSKLPTVHLRFAGAGRARRVAGSLVAGDGKRGGSMTVNVTVEPAGIPREDLRVDGPRVDFALTTVPDAAVGFDVRVDPPGVPLAWNLFLDDVPWPDKAVFAGPFGLPAVAARTGIASDDAREEVYGGVPPVIDPTQDLGLFVTRDRPGELAPTHPEPANAANLGAMQRVLEEWGYVHRTGSPPKSH